MKDPTRSILRADARADVHFSRHRSQMQSCGRNATAIGYCVWASECPNSLSDAVIHSTARGANSVHEHFGRKRDIIPSRYAGARRNSCIAIENPCTITEVRTSVPTVVRNAYAKICG